MFCLNLPGLRSYSQALVVISRSAVILEGVGVYNAESSGCVNFRFSHHFLTGYFPGFMRGVPGIVFLLQVL